MEANVAKVLVEAGEEMGVEMKVLTGYSGRGMYGQKTAAVEFDSKGDLMKAVAIAAVHVKEDESGEAPAILLEEFVESLDFRYDSMGNGMVAY